MYLIITLALFLFLSRLFSSSSLSLLLGFSLSMSSPSSSSTRTRFCFNKECCDFKLDHYRHGWRLRSDGFADLCHRCSSAYEQGIFCDIFHSRAHGWRCCESCGKRIHCGCIVSASAYVLLDAGGIECLACTRKKVSLGSNFAPPQSYFLQPPMAEKFRDLSMNWSSSTRPNQISCQPPGFLGPSVLQYDMHNRGDRYGYNHLTSKDRGMNDLMGKLMSENSKNHTMDLLNDQKAGTNCIVPPSPNVNVYHPLISLKEGPCGTQFGFSAPNTTPIVTNGHSRLDERNLQHKRNFSPLSRLPIDLNDGADSTFENKSWNFGTHLDTPGKYQVVPRYWPKDLNKSPDRQGVSNESDFVVTPLFEKILSATDAGKFGRLVLPKNSAEACFPRLSNPKGMPLKVQDSMGKEWTFQFRFLANGPGRKYVLDGVAECIQSMEVQAGDTGPEKKLIMDFRKARVAQSSDQEIDSADNISDTCTNGDTEPVETHSPSKVKKRACRAKEKVIYSSRKKKKSSTIVTRSKRQKLEKGDGLIELKLTRKEAQGCLLPPPNFIPSIVAIEGSEFEEYEDPPIIGKPTMCTTDSEGSSSSGDEELIAEQHDDKALEPTVTTRHPGHIICRKSPSGFGPKHIHGCCCKVCLTMKRRKRTLLSKREKKRTERAKDAQKKLDFDEKLLQCANTSGNTRKSDEHHSSRMIGEIDLNFQPEKDEEHLSASNTADPSSS